MKKILSFRKEITDFAEFLFPISFVCYILLFLLENIFPGFVSHNIDINTALIPVFILGFISLISKNEQNPHNNQKQEETILDFESESKEMPKLLFPITVVSSGVLFFAIVLTNTFFAETKTDEYEKQNQIVNKITPTPTLSLTYEIAEIQRPEEKLLKNTPITIINGTPKLDTASKAATILKENRFGLVKLSPSDGKKYADTFIQFSEKDATVAAYLTYLVRRGNENINMVPLETTASGIVLILGEQM